MHKSLTLLAVGTALAAAPALAQLVPGGVADVNVGGNVAVDPGATVGTVTDRVGQTVDRVDGTVNNAVDSTNLTLATREQVRAGAEIRDNKGNSVGTVQSIEGDTAVVVRGGKLYNVPLASIYHGAVGRTHGLVTKLPAASIEARAAASADAG
ncbi:hypothetical protein [Sphingopyxis kveilinensis]|uniref:hypothetical protein n=1 Tax=Sphingopyxis kveilinensis TaxID=3114367 RepID=UPI0030CE1005